MKNRFPTVVICVLMVHIGIIIICRFQSSGTIVDIDKKKLVVTTRTENDLAIHTNEKASYIDYEKPKNISPITTDKDKNFTKDRERLIKDFVEIVSKIEDGVVSVKNESLQVPNSVSIRCLSDIEDVTKKKDGQDYFNKLLSFFKERLALPDTGSVKLKLALIGNGQVKEIKVLSFESMENKVYLEKRLANLKFPNFNDNDAEKIFVLKFFNEE